MLTIVVVEDDVAIARFWEIFIERYYSESLFINIRSIEKVEGFLANFNGSPDIIIWDNNLIDGSTSSGDFVERASQKFPYCLMVSCTTDSYASAVHVRQGCTTTLGKPLTFQTALTLLLQVSTKVKTVA